MLDAPAGSIEGGPTPLSPVIAIPTYNHATKVLDVASGAAVLGWPVLIIDDGSTDDTAARVQAWIDDSDHQVELIRHPRNRGKAAAIRTAAQRAEQLGATHLVTIDADGQLDPRDIPRLLEQSRQHPRALILGQRPLHMEGCPARCNLGRRITSLAILAQTGQRLGDSQCGLRVYPIDLLRRVRCRSGRYSFEAEIITRACWAGFEWRECPVRCSYLEGSDRISHWKPWRDSSRQLIMHLGLAAEALLPWRRSGSTAALARQPLHRRLLRWLNPMRSIREIRSEQIGDLELGFGLGFGVFIGTLPFYGLHTAMSLYVAWRLHQQPAAVVLGSQISTPPLGIALAAVSITIGHLLLHGSLPDLATLDTAVDLFWNAPLTWFADWLVGSVPVGAILGAGATGVGVAAGRVMRSRSATSEPAQAD